MKKINTIMKILFAYITACGLVLFPLFLFEESIQLSVFGTWPASDARDWRLVKHGLDVISSTNRTMKIINYSLGWIQPLAFLSYRAYGKATDYYIESMKAKIFAHDPSAMVGERITVEIELTGGKVTQSEEGLLLQPRRKSIFVLFPYALIPREASLPSLPSLRVSGSIIHEMPDRIVLKVDFIHSVDL